eukprot:CAMPEP_0197831434 /NCGR_PEP_ID=MMETSP1437-20131217/10134_1 /TAXON_ID=49252 ORGANISM="Eucampia antarctica, Strain CCMP1452" /NCGR_SAMPLE_ID=MMETSP1437 /ASSEMBLY_ACC=CAM_ASM_001096 /LENGTH=283 /DNA_ID=CAMNT_0043434347 /DNA_START=77 /DNA_END=928 /DNA_ORIENTATION=+
MKLISIILAAVLPAVTFSFSTPASTSSRAFVSAVKKNGLVTTASESNSKLFADDSDDGWQAPKSAMIGGAGVNNAGEPPFEIRGFSLGNLVILLGVAVTILSFGEYLGDDAGEGLSISGLGFVYGIPIFLAGAALKYAEIDPVPCYSTNAADAVFESKATEIITKIKQDVTRHRYGDEAHLDTTVKKLGLVIAGKDYPQLKELRQDTTADGELTFTMVWQSKDTPYKMWNDERRRIKYEGFFGPNVGAECVKIDAEQRLVGIQLTTGGPKKIEEVVEQVAAKE